MKYKDNTLLNPNDTSGTLQHLWNKSAQQPGLHLSKRAATIWRLELIAIVEYPPRNKEDEDSNNWGSQLKACGTTFQFLHKRKLSQALSDSKDDLDSVRMPPPKSIFNYFHLYYFYWILLKEINQAPTPSGRNAHTITIQTTLTVKETVYKVQKLVMEQNVWRQLSPSMKVYIENEKFDFGVTKGIRELNAGREANIWNSMAWKSIKNLFSKYCAFKFDVFSRAVKEAKYTMSGGKFLVEKNTKTVIDMI